MSSSTPKRPVPRTVAMFLPPILALGLAVVYQQWQATQAQTSAAALCTHFKPGDPIKDFVLAALEADFKLQGEGAESQEVIAAKEVYRFEQESYLCRARHDGTKILSTATNIVRIN
jgi:hypothetical protein